MAAWHINADLYHQWEEAENRAGKWEQTYREERRHHREEIADRRAEFRQEMARNGRKRGREAQMGEER